MDEEPDKLLHAITAPAAQPPEWPSVTRYFPRAHASGGNRDAAASSAAAGRPRPLAATTPVALAVSRYTRQRAPRTDLRALEMLLLNSSPDYNRRDEDRPSRLLLAAARLALPEVIRALQQFPPMWRLDSTDYHRSDAVRLCPSDIKTCMRVQLLCCAGPAQRFAWFAASPS